MVDNLLIENYWNFLWRWDINSKIWFIWNEEQLKIHQTPLEKLENDNIIWNQIINHFWYENELSWSCDQYEIINLIVWKKNKNTDLFLSEIYFLPSKNGSSHFIHYWWEPPTSAWKRESYYENNWLIDKLEKRLDVIFSYINKSSKKIVIFYWEDKKKNARIEERFWKFKLINWTWIKENCFHNNKLYMTNFFSKNKMSSNDLKKLKEIIISF